MPRDPQTTDFIRIPRRLVAEIIAVHESDAMKGLYINAYVHGCEYTGPTFNLDELKAFYDKAN